jgi:hypothetical protein
MPPPHSGPQLPAPAPQPGPRRSPRCPVRSILAGVETGFRLERVAAASFARVRPTRPTSLSAESPDETARAARSAPGRRALLEHVRLREQRGEPVGVLYRPIEQRRKAIPGLGVEREPRATRKDLLRFGDRGLHDEVREGSIRSGSRAAHDLIGVGSDTEVPATPHDLGHDHSVRARSWSVALGWPTGAP